jgi:hypothetical protein
LPAYAAALGEVRNDVELRDAYRVMVRETPKMLLAGVDDTWDDGLRFERTAYGKTKIGMTLTFRDLGRSAKPIHDKWPSYALWFAKPPPPGAMAPFTTAWHAEKRKVRGVDYDVWLPN